MKNPKLIISELFMRIVKKSKRLNDLNLNVETFRSETRD